MASKLLGFTCVAGLIAAAAFSTVTAAAQRASSAPKGVAVGEPAPGLISVDTLKRVTETLSSDAFEGRAPATPGEEKTVRYLVEQMSAAGLKPGNGGSWFQDVPLVEITTDARTADLRIAGKGGDLVLASGKDVVLGTLRAQPKISLDASDMVFVGYGIVAPERGWNDYGGVDVKGKTVVVLVNDPDWKNPVGQGKFEGRAMTYYGRWTYKYEEAARQGAAGAIIVHDTEPAAYGWATVESSWTGPQLDMDSSDGGAKHVPVMGWMTKEAAQKVFAKAGQDLAALSSRAAAPGFNAVPLGLKANAALTTTIRRSRSRNVVGMLPGTARPDEAVIYSAHWDHIGRCTPDKTGDDICNGAVDNASGTAALIALAEAYRKEGPVARSVMFLAVTGEEAGLLGSQYYADNPIVPLAKTVAVINMDGLNLVGPTSDMVVIGAGKSELEDVLKRHAAAQKRSVGPEPTPEKGYFYRSDHFSFAKLGVPALYSESGENVRGKTREWARARADAYTADRYHQPGDEYDPNWDWSGAIEDLTLNYRIGRELATGSAWPNWYPTAEFRAARDKSRGTR
jgi:Zn-dependent M28 family amino/carboxypeptidase